jgi:hypothetical protein
MNLHHRPLQVRNKNSVKAAALSDSVRSELAARLGPEYELYRCLLQCSAVQCSAVQCSAVQCRHVEQRLLRQHKALGAEGSRGS